ncbi:hypothetical protein FD04_GL000875 [Secundilactobacillus odoratitofui DSM 19909 = JCM 15043]|uniref:Tropomyosin n=1 Tax=Secundilactobacillus odoratitofui DSM 19909 = JCM 15043 TaxID=1423776 RepID=A0A0R1LPZ5_9LACO|nr:hypothetical protein [Secundilactobacillus odoratitofui]KRK97902.1 hypothetical protein FD04_GL000875 [Secundilactobacillus odoratitofui DSM 19909 = JCM 15043]
MKRFLTSILLTGGAMLTMHLINKRQSPVDFATETWQTAKAKKEQLSEVVRQEQVVSDRLNQLQAELDKAQPAIDSLQIAANEFEFKIKPHFDLINDRLASLENNNLSHE